MSGVERTILISFFAHWLFQGMNGLLICSYDGMLFQLFRICCSIVAESYSQLLRLVVGTCPPKLAVETYVMLIDEIFSRYDDDNKYTKQ